MCWFVPFIIFYTKSKAMSATLVGYNFSPIPSKISFYIKQNSELSQPEKSQIIRPFDSQTESVSQEWLLPHASQACHCQQLLMSTQKHPVFVLALPISRVQPKSAGVLPQELGHWFCSQKWLSSGIALKSDCQMTGRGSNLDSNLNSAPWPKGCKLPAPESQNSLCVVWILFMSVETAEIEDNDEQISTKLCQV